MQTNILIVGGAGYIGAHTCKTLAKHGFTPVTFDNLSSGHLDFVRWGPLVRGDIADVDAVEEACRQWSVKAVIHFAAWASVAESIIDPDKYYGNNVTGTLALLEGMRRAGVLDIVFSSTCAVYGQPEMMPITEATPTAPVNPYGASKLMVERILSDFARAYGIRYTALRYFNAAGADPDGEVGELRDPEPHLIPRAMMALLGHIDDFQICGSDYPTADGSAVRDYIHVMDLAEAHRLALLRLLDGGQNAVMNLGAGGGYSVRQVISRIESITGRSLPAVSGPRRPGDPPTLIADTTFARQQIGFRPVHSDIDRILSTAWSWHQKAHPQRHKVSAGVSIST